MDNTVFIHLGPAKTGTSAIQQFLASHSESLADDGYGYAASCRCPYASHNPLAWILYHKHTGIHICRESKDSVSRQDKILYDFANEVESTREMAFILSSETFPALPGPALDELLGFFEGRTVKAVLYIRNVQALCLSLTMQHIKEQNFDSRDMRMKSLFEHIAFEYGDFVDLWAKKLGRQNLLFRKYGREYFDSGNICADFLKAVGIEKHDAFVLPDAMHNVSLRSAEALYFKDILNRMKIDLPETELIRRLIRWERENSFTRFDFPPRVHDRIEEAADRSHRYLLEHYLPRDFADYFKKTSSPAPREEFRFRFSHLMNMVEYLDGTLDGFGERFMESFTRVVDREFERNLAMHNFQFQAMKKATLASQAGRDREAVEILLECIRMAPDDKRPYHALSEIYIEAGNNKEALDILNKTPGAEPDVRTLELTGQCMEKLGDLDEAMRCAERALALDSASAPALNLLGVLAYRAGDTHSAERFFEEAVEADPGSGEAYSNLGVLKWDDNKTEALNLFEKGFILGPFAKEGMKNYHSAVLELKEYGRAEKVYEKVLALYPHGRMIEEKRAEVQNRRKRGAIRP